jgi:hypothetical protein
LGLVFVIDVAPLRRRFSIRFTHQKVRYPNPDVVTREKNRFVDAKAVDKSPVSRVEVPNYQSATEFVDLTVFSADPAIVRAHFGAEASSDKSWQLGQYDFAL